MFLVTCVWSSACLQARFPETPQATVLSVSQNLWATDTSRFLQQTPWLPRVQLVVGCLEHLFYVTYQLQNTARHLNNNWAKAGELNASSSDRHVLESVVSKLTWFPHKGNVQAPVKVLSDTFCTEREEWRWGDVCPVIPVTAQRESRKCALGLSVFCQVRDVNS